MEPASVARQLLPIADAISSVFEESRGDFLETIEVALSITADGDIAFLKGGEAALKLTFARQVGPQRV